MNELNSYSTEQIYSALTKLEYWHPTIFKWFFLWELDSNTLMHANDVKEFYKFSKEEIYQALLKFKSGHPAAYKAFFLWFLEEPNNPFDKESIGLLTEEDWNKIFNSQ